MVLELEIHDEVGDERASAVRFTYRAFSLTTQRTYENEYTVFVRSQAGRIHDVHEAMDTVAMFDFLRGERLGASFAGMFVGESDR